MLSARAHLSSGQSTTLVAAIGGSSLSGISSGALVLSPVFVDRETDGIDIVAGSGPGFTTGRNYSSADFYDFSVSLDGPIANPSSSSAVHFSGTAFDTSSTVASVEYSIDGSATWHPVAPTDGAFDSSAEDFTIDLDLPDYVYGLLVRQTGADGTMLPGADWAGKRFTIDTAAPGAAIDLAALVATDTGSRVAKASWLPSDPPSETASPVRYAVTLDGAEVATTYDTRVDIPLPDGALHTLAVTPVDAAGNLGPDSTFLIPAQAVITHAITSGVSQGHGTVTPSGVQTIQDGQDSPTFTFTPESGYHVADVLIDGVSAGAVTSHAFAGVTADHTISVTFAADTPVTTRTLTYTATPGGFIAGATTQVIHDGSDGTEVTAIPDPGYHFVGWNDLVLTANRSDRAVVADKSVSAIFAIDTFTITAGSGANGSITPAGPQSVDSGGSRTFTIAPDDHYLVSDVKVDGVSVGAPPTYTFADVRAGHTITASFALRVDPCTIAFTTKSTASLAYGSAFALGGTLKSGEGLAGQRVILQSGASAASIRDTSYVVTTGTEGAFSFSVKPSSRTYYRVRFAGSAGYAASAPSAAVYALPRANVGTPIAPSRMSQARSYSVYGSLKPRNTSGSYPVRIYKYRKVSGHWKSYGYVKARASRYSSYTKYSATVKLTATGSWRLRAYSPADSAHAATWSSGYDYVSVR